MRLRVDGRDRCVYFLRAQPRLIGFFRPPCLERFANKLRNGCVEYMLEESGGGKVKLLCHGKKLDHRKITDRIAFLASLQRFMIQHTVK